jgi:hypothetical protein
MAGDFWLSKEERWAVNNSLYHWALEFLISSVNDRATVRRLEEVRDANLGLVNLADFEPAVRSEILGLLRGNLVQDAIDRLPRDMPARESFISGLKNLADLASRALAKAS